MKLHQRLSLYCVATLIIAIFGMKTFASCPMMNQGPPCAEFWRADAVFIGVATSVVRIPNQTGLLIGAYVRSTVHFSVEEAFKGVEGTVVVFDSDHCGHQFTEGQRYLVYAHYNSYAKKLEVRAGNTRTRLMSEAAEDLAYIRGLPSAAAGTRIFGKVVQQVFNIKEGQFQIEPLKDIRVSLEGNNEKRELLTDIEGRYEFRGLAAGAYDILADLPGNLDYRKEIIKTTGRGCITYDIFAVYTARIKGRVLDLNGKPIRGVSVALVSADAKPEQVLSENQDHRMVSYSFTNPDGTYMFDQLPPGRYFLIINRTEIDRAQGSEIARTFPRYFYPGVSDSAAATVIVVDKDQKPSDYDFVLPVQQ